MGPRPDGYSLDRIHPNGNYEPENCRWASRKEQMNNQRRHQLIHYNGESLTLGEWANKIGGSYTTIRFKLDQDGWSIEEAI